MIGVFVMNRKLGR